MEQEVINSFLQRVEEMENAGYNIQQIIEEQNFEPKSEKMEKEKKNAISFDDIQGTDDTVGINMRIPKKIDDILVEYQKVYKEFSGKRKPRKDMLIWFAMCHGIDSIIEKTEKVRGMIADKEKESPII